MAAAEETTVTGKVEPGASLNTKFQALEERIALLEALLKKTDANDSTEGSVDGDAAPSVKVTVPAASEKSADDGDSKSPDGKGDEDKNGTLTPINTEAATEIAEKEKRYKEESRIRHVTRLWNDQDLEYKDVKQDEKKQEKKEEEEGAKESPRAFTYRKTLDFDNKTVNTLEIELEDADLTEAIKEAVRKVYGRTFFTAWGKPYKVQSPFEPIVICYYEIEEIGKAAEKDKPQLSKDIALLLTTVREAPDVEPYFQQRAESPNTITFRYVWTLFPPSTEIVGKPFFNQLQIFKVAWEALPFSNEDWETKPKRWRLHAWCYDWDGRDYVKTIYELKIETFEGAKDITQLAFYPIKYMKEISGPAEEGKPSLKSFLQSAIETGNKFKEFCALAGAQRMFQYEDMAFSHGKGRASNLLKDDERSGSKMDRYASSDRLSDRDDVSRFGTTTSTEAAKRMRVKGRGIVDAEAYLDRGSGQFDLGEMKPDYVYDEEDDIRNDTIPLTPEGDWARLCPPRLLGYALDNKSTVQFKLSSAKRLSSKKDTEAYDNELQLKQAQKDMLLALVDQHESGEEGPNSIGDIISEKGRSLVILLHGPPGVGKTLTAETVAKATGKPLLVVSVAEVGLKAEKAEAKLEQLFDLAAKWEAILLVDEADVFLESRSSDADPERNALVSVLLRALEYYTGTIILTTNRISSLDIAVQSRIHLSIKYGDLTDEDCAKIFDYFCSKVKFEDSRQEKRVKEWFKDDVADEGLNGRQIRNLVTSAYSIARSKDRMLDLACFKSVFKVTQEFQKQLTNQTARYRAANEVNYDKGK